MCRCTPSIRTPFCGKPGCVAPGGYQPHPMQGAPMPPPQQQALPESDDAPPVRAILASVFVAAHIIKGMPLDDYDQMVDVSVKLADAVMTKAGI